MIELYPSLFDRTISRLRSPWVLFGIAVFFILFSMGAAVLDGQVREIYFLGLWRTALLPPAVIIYILAVAPRLQRMGPEVIRAFRPVVQMDDASFAKLVWDSSVVPRRNEILAIIIGGLVGFWMANSGNQWSGFSWTRLYWSISNSILFALLAWVIYGSIAATHQTAVLHRQRLQIDLFDLAPFVPVGRQSLWLALVFVGGILISLVFGVQMESLRVAKFWVVYSALAVVPVVIFFLNMRPTHYILVEEKKKRLANLNSKYRLAFQQVELQIQQNELSKQLADEINALSIYEQHLQAARTWPYNTSQLRALVFTVLIPLATLLARLMLNRLFQISL